MKIYKLVCKDFGHRFSFNAKNDEEAESKRIGWLTYQGMLKSRNEFWVEETTDSKWIHNEYMA